MDDKEIGNWETTEANTDPDEVGFEPESEVEDVLDAPWINEQGPIFDKPLDDLLDAQYWQGDVVRTGIKYLPVGLLTYWRRLKARKRKSMKTIQYHNSRHGYMIAVHDDRIKQLAHAYTVKCREAETKSDVVALRQLEQKEESVEFVNPAKYATSIVLPKDMEGCLSSLSAALGVSNVKLYCWLCTLSLLTLKGNSGFKAVIQKEVDNFWIIVEKRLKGLS
jgi:hypothetical protein